MPDQQKDILIVGAGLTGLTIARYLQKAGMHVTIVEKNSSPGGVIQTISEDGFTFESGPNTGVVGSPELVQLFDELGLEFEVPGNTANERWIWKKNRWHALPTGLIPSVKTPLFRLRDKLRVLGEPFRSKGSDPDETLSDMVRRRLGDSFLDYAVDPFIGGIYAGDPDKLITRYALPKLYALENNFGSFIRGAIKKKKMPKTHLEARVTRKVFSVKGGLSRLTEALVSEIGEDNIITKADEISIEPFAGGFRSIFIRNGARETIQSRLVISTVESHSIPAIFPFINDEQKQTFRALRYAGVVQVVAGFKEWKGIPIKAFGGLVPSAEKKDILGILFPSALFSGRAPENGALLSVFIGGIRRPELSKLNDDAIRTIVQNALKEMMHCEVAPDLFKIFRYERAIPQYEINTGERLQVISDIEAQYPGLYLAGNLKDGIGMADRVKQAIQLATQINNQSIINE